jgi:OOP family OmpA-OmpF porin
MGEDMKHSNRLLATLVFAVPAVCFAQAPAQVETGGYIGLSAGESTTSFDTNDYSFNNANVRESYDKTKSTFKALGGYNFNKNWALEGGYVDFGKPKIDYTGSGALAGLTGQGTVKDTSWFLAVKGTIPVTNAFGLFAKLGATRNKSELAFSTNNAAINTAAGAPVNNSNSRTGALVGVGAEYSFAGNWRVRAEYEEFGKFGNLIDPNVARLTATGRTKPSLWSVGLTFSF